MVIFLLAEYFFVVSLLRNKNVYSLGRWQRVRSIQAIQTGWGRIERAAFPIFLEKYNTFTYQLMTRGL